MKKNLGFSSSIIAAALALTGGCVGPNPDYIGPGQIVDGAPTTNADAGTEPGVDGGSTNPDLTTPCPKPLEAAIGTTTGFEYAKCALVAGPRDGSSATAATPDLVWYPKGTDIQLVYQSETGGTTSYRLTYSSGATKDTHTNMWVMVPRVESTVYSPLTGNGSTPLGFHSFLIKGGVVSQRYAQVDKFTLWTP